MITYSRKDMQRQLSYDQRLWGRVPGAAAALLWPLLVVALGWNAGSIAALASIVLLAVLSVALPSRLSINIYVVDLLERLLRLPVWLFWLGLVWHLSAREPIFPILGTPIPGALAATALAFVAARVLIFASRFAAQRVQGTIGGA